MIKKAIIYKIEDLTTREFYIGSTIQPLNTRLHTHIYTAMHPELKRSCSCADIILRDNYNVIILKEFENITKKKLIENEANIITTFRHLGLDCVNKKIPTFDNSLETKKCDVCNLEITIRNFKRHLLTKRHLNNLSIINDN